MSFENGLFIFRRDYRITDNIGLSMLNSKCKNVYTMFVFTPEQVGKNNSFKSHNAIQFMIESLDHLAEEIKNAGGHLHCFYGDNVKIVDLCIKTWDIQCVCFNSDFTPYALDRDREIANLCKKRDVVCETAQDYYLYEPGTVFNVSGNPYQKFTPYYNTVLHKKVELPIKLRKMHLQRGSIHSISNNTISLEDAMRKFTVINPDIMVTGGRSNGLNMLSNAVKNQKHYDKTHNELHKSTSLLSAYIKFGCISIREVYHAFYRNKELIRQLIWRDFYMNILYNYPYVLEKPMKLNYAKIKWHSNQRLFNAWTTGNTGFPVVDAGMRQMNETGYMHNRARLITSSFLIKTLLIDWRHGEKYFATKLVDYDPASNNGNWQWNASTGADSQPYFRIFNPWLQSKEYDPDAEYIKRWIPELREVSAKDIHSWYKSFEKYKNLGAGTGIKYNKPIVDYDQQKVAALQLYKSIF